MMAFGSILDGPDEQKLKPLVEQAMPRLIEALSDLVEGNFVLWGH